MIVPFLFHPKEVAFCGYSNSGKTTLITKLLKELSRDYKIGYVKHDAHSFEMDRPGKDTFEAAESGAAGIFINDSAHYALIKSGEITPPLRRMIFADADFVFLEGYKDSDQSKIILIDPAEKVLTDIIEKRFKNVIAYVGATTKSPALDESVPYFQRDDIRGIGNWVSKHFGLLGEGAST